MARNALTPSRARPSGLTGFNPLMSLNRDINRLFDDLLQPSALPTMADTAVATALITPQINVSETDTEIRITAELPGMDKQDLEVQVEDEFLVLRGEKKLESKNEEKGCYRIERSFAGARAAVALLDTEAMRQHRPVTRALAAELFRDHSA